LIERDDDKSETARHRIRVYLDQTLPVLEHYRKQGVVAEVSGEGDIEDVRRRVLEAIGRSDREQR
jgi:adenylate kinase